MSETTKTVIYPEGGAFGGNGVEAMLLGSAMNGGGFGGNGMNNPFWAIILLAFLRNGFGFGNGDNNCQLSQIQDTLNTNQGNTLLMDAIKGNAGAIRDLAGVIGCNHNAVTAAINGVQSAICNVGNQLGMGTAQVINAVQSGNCQVAQAVKDCCCTTQQNILKMGYDNQINNLQQSQLIQNGFCQVGYEAAQNANGIKQSIGDQTLAITSKIDALESARKDREINALTAQLATVNARAERAAELAPIIKTLEEIKGKQPNTVPVPWPQLTAIPTTQLYDYGRFGVNGGIFG